MQHCLHLYHLLYVYTNGLCSSPPLPSSSPDVTSVVKDRQSLWHRGTEQSMQQQCCITTSSQRELTEHRELILEAGGIQTATCSCLSAAECGGEGTVDADSSRAAAVLGSAGGAALCVWGECQGAASDRTWCSLKSLSSSWIPAPWSSHQWMKSGPTCT